MRFSQSFITSVIGGFGEALDEGIARLAKAGVGEGDARLERPAEPRRPGSSGGSR